MLADMAFRIVSHIANLTPMCDTLAIEVGFGTVLAKRVSQVVRQPDWGVEDRPLTRKSSDWESTNINSKVGRPDPYLATPSTFCLPNSILLKTGHRGSSQI